MRNLLLLSLVSVALRAADVPVHVPAEKPWDARLGSHRAVVEAPAGAAVRVRLDWRRRDAAPEKKAVWVHDAAGKRVANAAALGVDNEGGDLVFQAEKPGTYFAYYLPVQLGGGAFPWSKYDAPEAPADAAWATAAGLAGGGWKTLPAASVTRWEARTAFDGFTAMEVIATAAETRALAERHAGLPFVTFLEDRAHSTRMFNFLPARWADGVGAEELSAQPNEYLVFQIPVWAHRAALSNVVVRWESPRLPGAFQCFNLGGQSDTARPLAHRVQVAQGRVQPLWCGLDLPRSLPPGLIEGVCTVQADGLPPVRQPVRIRVGGPVLEDRGDGDPQKLTKLRWLNSTLGNDDSVTKPYTPITVKDRVLGFLGREVELGEDGLPARITSFFHPGNTRLVAQPTQILAAPMRFVVERAAGGAVPLRAAGFTFTDRTPGRVEWTARFAGEGLSAEVRGRAECDGALFFEVALTGDLPVRDVRLECPRHPATTTHAIGMHREAGRNEPEWTWTWDLRKNQDSVWLGAVNAGLRLQLKDHTYVRPGVNIHYSRRPLNPPVAWVNDGRGGVRFHSTGTEAALVAFSGQRTLRPDQPLRFDFDLLVTPFHPLNTADQWKDRYFHTGGWPADLHQPVRHARTEGANVVNIHQGNLANPYINFPFLTADKLRAITEFAHAQAVRVKFYYTVRELSNWTPELFALRSMGNELLLEGRGGGHPWLEEHLGGDYWGAWYEPGAYDASVLTAPTGRWNNLYIEGLRWLVENAGCDGIYLDDISYDRVCMRRARKVLDQFNPRGGLIDLHSWNEFHPGGAWAQCANIFMDSFPFLDRLWFGEGHHYSGPPAEHFLVELSGIPFGLMGEMLEGGGNVWFGLNHGMTGRLGWQGDPRPIWKLWDDFGVAGCDFTGWWDSTNPVRTGDDQVKATLYRREDRVLLSLANYHAASRVVRLDIDWQALGLDPARAFLHFPEIKGLQREGAQRPGDPIRLSGHKGAAIWIDHTPREIPPPPPPLEATLGTLLLEEPFADAGFAGWTPRESPRAQGSLRADAGLVVVAPANVTAYLERPLPEHAGAVLARVWQDPRDEGNSWGPGFALAAGDKALKFGLRKDGRFHVGGPGGEQLRSGRLEVAPVTLIAIWDAREFRLVASGPGMLNGEEEIARLPRNTLPAGPLTLRVGKLSPQGGPNDHGEAGATGFNRIEWLKIHAVHP